MPFLDSIRDALRRFVRIDEGLDVTGYVAELERHFSVRLAPAEIESARTLGEMSDLIARKLLDDGRGATSGGVWPELRRITSHEFGVDARELVPDVRYVEDLNC